MRDRKPGHIPIDDFTQAVKATRTLWECLNSYQTDLNKSKMDPRIFSEKTCQLIRESGIEFEKLRKILEIAAAEIRKQEGETH